MSEAVWSEILRAASDAHIESLQQRGRGSRAAAQGSQSREQIAAYYRAEDAAKAALKRAHPVAKPQRQAAAALAAADETEADIERERKRNIVRNHEVLASLGLA